MKNKLVIITDRGYFTFSVWGIQIHSGNLDDRYDHNVLREGKYLPGFDSRYEATCEADSKGFFRWTLEFID